MGFPILITPIEPFNPFWALVLPLLAPVLRRLPYGWGEFVDYNSFNWCVRTRNRVFRELGPAIVVVNPGGLKIMLADGGAAEGMYGGFLNIVFFLLFWLLGVIGKLGTFA